VKRNRAALVTSVSTAMLGAGWAAGVVGTAVAAQDAPLTATIGAADVQSPSIDTSTGTSTSPSPSASPSAAATDPAAPAPAPAAPSGTFDGATVRTRYGDYQAQIIVDAGAITNIAMLQSGANDGTSRQISGYALPQLISAVLQSQTANVAYVSGASYTSQGFEASVQDAMARAGL
jgi:uncharacterized protein with FMN-binding domain